ncbi:MBL fold metallo-hydrolase [Actinomadura sp. DC4]|uniref:MBL fold metallo-hydrolase n=1 Tax=Actinomadura sp. DC4 TaxID=3055069 RepID=UPI0025B1B04B|nr:MBL fold metallo-hydrolase [Actinomadura sp. DC4]MDN3357946.1 MBL fold metallo-hydrolase [Actinomadura sp. DC4]
MTATVHILTCGYAGDRVAGTVTLIQDGDLVAVVDPGMVADRRLILDPVAELGFGVEDVTDVVFSHHHPDHTLNAALFPAARFHDHWAIYSGDRWDSRDAEGFELSPSVRLMKAPGHTAQDIATLVETADGLVAATHLWWHADGPEEDPLAEDPTALRASRERLLALRPSLIIPGHGAPFAVDG